MKKKALLFFLITFYCIDLYGQTNNTDTPVSFKLAFHDMARNTLHSFAYNYGLNFAAAGLVTYGSIESGFDLYWRNIAYNNTILSNAGLASLYVGFAVPVFTPVVLYVAGQKNQNTKLQITALALTQSLFLTLAVQTPLKMLTGRAGPGIVNNPAHTRGLATDDNSRTFNWFSIDFINGWPSGHTANAFSAAATIAEMYKDNWWIKIGAYSYAALIGFGVSVNVHWASEVFAGALIGYAIGKTVGKSFSQLLKNTTSARDVSFYATPNSIGVFIPL